jgi:hypothetical protein
LALSAQVPSTSTVWDLQTLELARQIGSAPAAPAEAHALAGLARCVRATGRTAEAEAGLRQALAIFQRTGASEAADVSAELDALPGAPGPTSTSPRDASSD